MGIFHPRPKLITTPTPNSDAPSVLDHRRSSAATTRGGAIEETPTLAKRADELGYHRYCSRAPCDRGARRSLSGGAGGAPRRRDAPHPRRHGRRAAALLQRLPRRRGLRMLEALYPPHRPRHGRAPAGRRGHRAGGRRRRVSRRVAFSGARSGSFCGHLDGTLRPSTPSSRCACSPRWPPRRVWLLGSSDYAARSPRSSGCRSRRALHQPQGGDGNRPAPTPRTFAPGGSRSESMVCTFLILRGDRRGGRAAPRPIDLRRLHMAASNASPGRARLRLLSRGRPNGAERDLEGITARTLPRGDMRVELWRRRSISRAGRGCTGDRQHRSPRGERAPSSRLAGGPMRAR